MNVVYLALGSAGSFLGCVLSLRQVLNMLKKRWLEDDRHAQAQRENTKAVQELTTTMVKVSRTLDDHERRLRVGGL